MGNRYLTDLAKVLADAGLTVVEVDGWQSRARSSGGFADGLPSHLMIHHTASPVASDGQRDVDYITKWAKYPPISNLYTQRNGVVWVCAAGASNTNGKGSDSWGGGVPDDRMNEYGISNEIANTGTGEQYPIAQQESVLRSSAAICSHYGIPTNNVRAHFEWTSRKIDPSGPSLWAPNGGKWDMNTFRRSVADAESKPKPEPEPELENTDMLFIARPTFAGAPNNDPWLVYYANPGNGPRVERATNAHVRAAEALGVPIVEQDSAEQYNDARDKYGI